MYKFFLSSFHIRIRFFIFDFVWVIRSSSYIVFICYYTKCFHIDLKKIYISHNDFTSKRRIYFQCQQFNMLNDIMMNYLQTMHVQMMKQQWHNAEFQQMMMNMRIEATAVTSTSTSSNPSHKKSKTQLFKIESYDEKDLVLYFQFEFKVRIKLFIDEEAIGDEKN